MKLEFKYIPDMYLYGKLKWNVEQDVAIARTASREMWPQLQEAQHYLWCMMEPIRICVAINGNL